MMKKTFTFLLLFISSVWLTSLHLVAQVTIGTNEAPNIGALLDLKMNNELGANSSKGLIMPRVALKDIKTETDLGKTMGATEANSLEPLDHIGLIVYNTATNTESEEKRFCPGLHVWNGTKWLPLKPYPEIRSKKADLISLKRSFEYLDPTNPNGWPADKETARAAGRYDLGRIVNTDTTSPNGTEDLVDQRLNDATNTYTTSRFYVGYKIITQEYSTKTSYDCSYDEPNWDNVPLSPETVTEVEKIFDEGIWMTQNLRATKTNDGKSLEYRVGSNYPDAENYTGHYYIPGHFTDQNAPQISNTEGILYNWAAAIGAGTSTGPTTFPNQDNGGEQGGSTKRDVTYQGICPDGWYLPSEQEWTDLANGIQRNVSSTTATIFADKLDGNTSTLGYDDTMIGSSSSSGFGGYLGQAMKSKTPITTSTNGKSKTYTSGGFDAYMVGSSSAPNANGGIGQYVYGDAAYFWSSSLNGYKNTNVPERIYAYYVWLTGGNENNNQNFYKGRHIFFQTFSVRCKKVTE